MDRQPDIENFAPPRHFGTFGLLGVFTALRKYREAYSAHATQMTRETAEALGTAQAGLLSAALMMPMTRVEEGQQVQTMEPRPGHRIALGLNVVYDLHVPMTPEPSRDLPIWWAYEAERIAQEVWHKLEAILISQTRQFEKRAAWERQRGAGLMPGATKLD